ncbi:MAG: hypothetical protein HC945_03750 [Nitrosarchaeum sp.]|nr:hypothetical protein [Nitrosarchaeum sp.]
MKTTYLLTLGFALVLFASTAGAASQGAVWETITLEDHQCSNGQYVLHPEFCEQEDSFPQASRSPYIPGGSNGPDPMPGF